MLSHLTADFFMAYQVQYLSRYVVVLEVGMPVGRSRVANNHGSVY